MKALAPNTLIQNRYLIVHLIGKGGMGEVYLAVDQRLGSAVALKRTFFADDEMLGGAFEREARTLARLRHPVLPKVSDHFVEGGEQYLVMEHIAGDDLCKRLEAAQKAFPVNWVLYWADQLLDALAYLHSHEPPIIHRDIKPQNLKLTDENHIVLLDFGLAKNTAGQSLVSTGGGSGSSGSVIGYTPHYAPMEQIRGTGTSPRSDIYSLSATLYQLLTNVVPADALTRADAMLSGDADPIRPINEINPEVAPAVSEIILRGMNVSQEKRFANAKEMQRALRKAYTQVQDAMAASTVAFSTSDLRAVVVESERGTGVPSSMQSPVGDATRPREEPPSTPLAERWSAEADSSSKSVSNGSRQSDIRTEVYQQGQVPQPSEFGELPQAPPVMRPTNSAGSVGAPADLISQATIPAIALDRSDYSHGARESSATDVDPYATFVAAAGEDRTSAASTSASPHSRKTKNGSSKASLIIGVLAGLLVASFVAGGAGWYVYSNYYASASPATTPTPEPTVEEPPVAQPTIEGMNRAGANASDSNSAGDQSAETVVEPDINTSGVETRPPQGAARRPAVRTASPNAPRPAPKPTAEASRPQIVQ